VRGGSGSAGGKTRSVLRAGPPPLEGIKDDPPDRSNAQQEAESLYKSLHPSKETTTMAMFDTKPLADRLSEAGANLHCLSCGAENVTYSATRYSLTELGSDDKLAVEPEWGLTSGLRLAARVCLACSYIHLYALAVVAGDLDPL
jgi:hypothetical protein